MNVSNFAHPNITAYYQDSDYLSGARGIVYSETDEVVFVAAYGSSRFTVLDVSSNGITLKNSVQLTKAYGPTSLAHDSVNGIVYVACFSSDSIVYIDVTDLNNLEERFLLQESSVLHGISDIKFDRFNSRLYTASKNGNAVAAIDVLNRTKSSTLLAHSVVDSSYLAGVTGLTFKTNLGNDLPGLTAIVVGCSDGDMGTLLQVVDNVTF